MLQGTNFLFVHVTPVLQRLGFCQNPPEESAGFGSGSKCVPTDPGTQRVHVRFPWKKPFRSRHRRHGSVEPNLLSKCFGVTPIDATATREHEERVAFFVMLKSRLHPTPTSSDPNGKIDSHSRSSIKKFGTEWRGGFTDLSPKKTIFSLINSWRAVRMTLRPARSERLITASWRCRKILATPLFSELFYAIDPLG